MKKKLILLVIALTALAISFKYFHRPCNCSLEETITIGGIEVAVDIADTPQERMQGLSGRESLGESEGMLFVLDEPAVPAFWMKDMNFAIDIIWINSQRRVIGVERDISPQTFPDTFRPSEAIKYVLEVPAGFSQRHTIDIGDELFFAN